MEISGITNRLDQTHTKTELY